mmetsp:Transcript_81201/g.99512  ORF Transcript_81201/g.99512 Transcript_81201/m.99512 type:complete len:211 (-) Transcript_81201:2149-2781(-)
MNSAILIQDHSHLACLHIGNGHLVIVPDTEAPRANLEETMADVDAFGLPGFPVPEMPSSVFSEMMRLTVRGKDQDSTVSPRKSEVIEFAPCCTNPPVADPDEVISHLNPPPFGHLHSDRRQLAMPAVDLSPITPATPTVQSPIPSQDVWHLFFALDPEMVAIISKEERSNPEEVRPKEDLGTSKLKLIAGPSMFLHRLHPLRKVSDRELQ